jgi:2-polyprenyl-6-methoxyphenol hydroxylase-like FAD-dependent oxidoreductase
VHPTSQCTLEPLLLNVLAELANVEVRFDAGVASFTESGQSVTLRHQNSEDVGGSAQAAYLIGRDGASSRVGKGCASSSRERLYWRCVRRSSIPRLC